MDAMHLIDPRQMIDRFLARRFGDPIRGYNIGGLPFEGFRYRGQVYVTRWLSAPRGTPGEVTPR
jgi:hypothetical protein